MSLHGSTRKVASQAGIPEYKVEQVADDIDAVMNDKGLGTAVIVPYVDMNGPMVDKASTNYETHQGVAETVKYLHNVSETGASLLSGWDISTLKYVASEKLGVNMDHVGELGAVTEIDGEIHSTVDVGREQILNFRKNAWLEAASREMTLQEQGNVSAVTGCMYGEGARSDLYNNPIAESSRQKFSMDLLSECLERRETVDNRSYSQQGDSMVVDLSSMNTVAALSDALTEEYPLVGLKWESVGDQAVKITENSFEQSELSDEEFLEEFQSFMDGVAAGTNFETDHNPDCSTDFQRTDVAVSKEHGAEYRADMITEDETDYILVNMGDKPGDILEGEQTVFVGQRDMPVEEELEERDMSYAKADTAADYSLGLAEVIKRRN
ncbi:hypothetical protein [Candidatus Nanohalococcus occultus]|uniref:Uncharacterized protein n=1 Tax=Candidatus Nanohalococcus occultus TaxID=2978047 RepID=A0ABY8CED2_9ARCH|nr:hypothetical protein SVXNc_0560 [Candidatus Nanohaloarchaeota archaeon SVXNc]